MRLACCAPLVHNMQTYYTMLHLHLCVQVKEGGFYKEHEEMITSTYMEILPSDI